MVADKSKNTESTKVATFQDPTSTVATRQTLPTPTQKKDGDALAGLWVPEAC